YNVDEYHIQKFEIEQIASDFRIQNLKENYVNWLNFHSIEERASFELLFENQGFHKLTLEDVYTDRQRPKLEEFVNYQFFSIQSALPKENHSKLQVEQISFI